MTSTLKIVALAVVLSGIGISHLAAQTGTAQVQSPQVQLSSAEKKFDELVQTFETYLYSAGAFQAEVTSDWTYRELGETKRGTNLFFLAVEKGGKYRIEAGSVEKGKAAYVCVSDARQVTRLHKLAKFYSQHPASAAHDELQQDALTLEMLSGSGVEYLIRPQIRAQLISQIRQYELVGDESLDGQAVTHMRLTLRDGPVLDVWFSKQQNPLLLKLVASERIPVSDQQAIELVTSSRFQWKVGGPLPTTYFSVTIPADARKVEDLLTALRDGDLRQMLGKPAPLLELKDMAGKPVRLADYRGKKVVVLIFWASWCAPSINSMDSLNSFVAEAESNGAVVLAINLGESLAQVRETIGQYKYRGTVLLDPETSSLDAYRIGELPMTIMIGKDGTMQSFQSGSTAEARQRIRLDTATLLQGKSLITEGVRRP